MKVGDLVTYSKRAGNTKPGYVGIVTKLSKQQCSSFPGNPLPPQPVDCYPKWVGVLWNDGAERKEYRPFVKHAK